MKLMTGLIAGLLTMGALKAEDRVESERKKRCQDAKSIMQLNVGIDAKQEVHNARELYFYGVYCVSKSEAKKKIHIGGFNAAKRAIQLLTTGSTDSTVLAEAHYFAAINLSRWGQAKGVLSALGRWDEVKEYLDVVVANDPSIEDYGVYRTFGRAYMSLPFFKGGSNKKSHQYLEKAYQNTLNTTFDTSSNTLTTLFYLDILSKRNKIDDFCEVYSSFEEILSFNWEDAKRFNPTRTLETMLDIRDFNNSSEDWMEEIKDRADIDC